MPITQLDHVSLVRAGAEPSGEVQVLRHFNQREAVDHVRQLERTRHGEGPSLVSRTLATARAELDPHWREARRLRADPNYRPVRGYTVAEAVSQGLLPPETERLSELDRLLSAAPVEQLDGSARPLGPLPSLGDFDHQTLRLLSTPNAVPVQS